MSISFVNSAVQLTAGQQTSSIAYAPTAGNTLILGVYLESERVTVSQVFDDVGADIFGNPINSWQNLGTVDLGSLRLELWGCCPVITPGTEVTVQLTGVQDQFNLAILEYSGVATFGQFGTASNTGYNNLFFNGTAINNTNVLVAFFGSANSGMTSGSGKVPPQNIAITPAVQRVGQSGWGGQILVLEQTVISKDLLTAEAVLQTIPSLGIACCGVVLNGGFVLSTKPGFSDIDPSKIVAGTPGTIDETKVVHAMTLAQIASNAALGIVRPEFFYGVYQDGDTVIEPISPVDSYQYQRDELIYIYTPITTFDPTTGWVSASGILFYAEWNVDPDTGKVDSIEYYHPDGNSPTNRTSDGQLLVLTVAQRVQGGLTLSIPPSLAKVDTSLIGQDKPATQTQLRVMAKNSKFAAVKAEVMYMGEFVDGQVVTPPISPADGYVYDYDEVKFISSWLWTSSQASFGPPPMANADGSAAHGGWSQLQRLEASVSATGLVHCQVFFFNNTEIDPTQPANGGQAFGRLRVFAFCQRNKGPYFGLPQLDADAANQTSTFTVVAKISAAQLDGAVTGDFSVDFTAGTGHALAISKAVIKRTLPGDDTVIDTTPIKFGGSDNFSVPPGSTKTSDVVSSWTFDAEHDYYICMAFQGQYRSTSTTGQVNTTTPELSGIISGDTTSATTITALGYTPDLTHWAAFSKIRLTIVSDATATGFTDIPISALIPGQPLTEGVMSALAENVKTGAYAVEFFGPTNHVNGDTVSLPTSPTDGYAYSRQELIYIWQWHTTGTPTLDPRLWGFGCTISPAGVINMMSWHVPPGGPINNNTANASIDVLVIATRSKITEATLDNPGTNNGNPPSDLSDLQFGGTGGFVINGGS